MSVLLGLCDEQVDPGTATDWSTNKIGGKADWMIGVLPRQPTCGLCGQSLSLITQVYCPLGESSYYRTLYIFACCHKSCWNRAESWQVLRAQMLDQNHHTDTRGGSYDDSAFSDWGESRDKSSGNGSRAADWCDDADSWGGDGDEDSDLISMVTDKLTISQNGNSEIKTHDSVKGYTLNEDLGSSEEATEMEQSGSGSADDSSCAADAECIAEVVAETPSYQLMETVLRLPGQQQAGTDQTETSSITVEELVSYYINVFDEPADSAHQDLQHERHLLADYSRQEGLNLEALLTTHTSSLKCSGKGKGSGGTEGYEKSQARHGDQTFLRFTKRISSCPQQILRYEYGGKPLYLTTPPKTIIPPCPHCGATRVFELQLMPSLVGVLKIPNIQDPSVEFGTVLVYTCGRSCWDDNNTTMREEFVIVQADPDSHLFR